MHIDVLFFQLTPSWKPDIKSDSDTKYIPEEFSTEPVELTPPGRDSLESIDEETDELPYFEQFSYHGSRGSMNSFLSASASAAMNTSVF